jgi:hypothetical protein
MKLFVLKNPSEETQAFRYKLPQGLADKSQHQHKTTKTKHATKQLLFSVVVAAVVVVCWGEGVLACSRICL